MSITGALLLFLGLFLVFSLLLYLYGGVGTLYVVSLFLLLGLILKIRLRRRRGPQLDGLQQLPEHLRQIPGLEPVREELQREGFQYHRAFLFDDIGRYAEIHARDGVFAEIIWDEDEAGLPLLRLQSFFQNGLTVSTQSGCETENREEGSGVQEQHWIAARNLGEVLAAHRQRVDQLCRSGLGLEKPAAEQYSEPRRGSG